MENLNQRKFPYERIVFQCSKLKKNPGCPYFKSRATKAVNLVALMNPWLPGRKMKNNTSWLTTRYKFSFDFWNFCINTITANHRAIWCELQPRSLVFPCFLRSSFSFFFLIVCIRLAQISFLLGRRLYTSQKSPHLHSVKDNSVLLIEDKKNQNRNIEFKKNMVKNLPLFSGCPVVRDDQKVYLATNF